MSDEKQKSKVKVYRIKIGPVLLAFRRKMREGEVIETHTRAQLLAADAWQARFFGYKPLGFRKHFMSRASIRDYLERSFSAQPEAMKARAMKVAHRSASRKARILNARNAK